MTKITAIQTPVTRNALANSNNLTQVIEQEKVLTQRTLDSVIHLLELMRDVITPLVKKMYFLVSVLVKRIVLVMQMCLLETKQDVVQPIVLIVIIFTLDVEQVKYSQMDNVILRLVVVHSFQDHVTLIR